MDNKRAVASGKLCTSHFVNFMLEILNTFQKKTSNPISISAKSKFFPLKDDSLSGNSILSCATERS